MSSEGNFLSVETSAGLMDVYVAGPTDSGNHPVVIVLQEAFGVNNHIKDVCHRLASEGFLAAAPELYHREGRHLIVNYEDRKAFMPLMGTLTNKRIIDDVRNTLNFLENLPGADLTKINCIGFCVGGFAAALCASKLKLNKMVSFYGGGIVHAREGFLLSPLMNDLKLIKSKSLFFFGGQDASIPMDDIRAIKEKLANEKVPAEVIVYPEANHGFFCNERKSFNKDAAEAAWKLTTKFFKE